MVLRGWPGAGSLGARFGVATARAGFPFATPAIAPRRVTSRAFAIFFPWRCRLVFPPSLAPLIKWGVSRDPVIVVGPGIGGLPRPPPPLRRGLEVAGYEQAPPPRRGGARARATPPGRP